MAVIDLSTGSGIRSSGVPVPAARRLITAGLPVMTPTPAVTPASVSAALQPEFAALQALLAAVPAEVWAAAARTLTGAANIAAAVRVDQASELAKVNALAVDGSGRVAADVRAVSGQSIVGTGTETDPWGPAP